MGIARGQHRIGTPKKPDASIDPSFKYRGPFGTRKVAPAETKQKEI